MTKKLPCCTRESLYFKLEYVEGRLFVRKTLGLDVLTSISNGINFPPMELDLWFSIWESMGSMLLRGHDDAFNRIRLTSDSSLELFGWGIFEERHFHISPNTTLADTDLCCALLKSWTEDLQLANLVIILCVRILSLKVHLLPCC